MGDDKWSGKPHAQIIDELNRLTVQPATDAGDEWTKIGTDSNRANTEHVSVARDRCLDTNRWQGKGPLAAFDNLDRAFKATARAAALAEDIGKGLGVDADILGRAIAVSSSNPEPVFGDAAAVAKSPQTVYSKDLPEEKKQAIRDEHLQKIRREAQTFYTDALTRRRPSLVDQLTGKDDYPKPPSGWSPPPSSGGGNSSSGGAGPESNKPNNTGNTKPASDEGAGQGQGQGGGQGGGQGSGSGGGSPSGGGSGSGSGLGSGLGTDSKGGSGYSPLGSTTAAGYSPTSAAGAGAGAGLGSLRAGGLPPGAAGAGTGGAGAGGAGGMRGGGMGMGGMGMAPMGGAHGRGGNGEDDDEHETPDYLINMDNGSELFGNLPKASPGVIGDWSEHDEVEKRREEAEIKRYKSMGWNVKWQ